MAERLQGPLSAIERAPRSRYVYVLVFLVIAALIPWSGWDYAGASTSVFHNRLFLLVAALVGAVIAVTVALAPWWGKVRTRLIAAHLLIMGLYLGVAIATTDWSAWPMRGWWQGLGAFPLLGGQVQQILKLLRYGGSPIAGDPHSNRAGTL